MGSTNIYTEREGKPVYDFTIVDRIIDAYLARDIHPYLEIGFMPEAMSSASADVPYRRPWQPGVDYKGITAGWSYPPRDYAKWAELVYQWTRHNVERYGRAEVERWYFEVWNEPNLEFYWLGTPKEFYRLHDYAIDAVRRDYRARELADRTWRDRATPSWTVSCAMSLPAPTMRPARWARPWIFFPSTPRASPPWRTDTYEWASPSTQDRR